MKKKAYEAMNAQERQAWLDGMAARAAARAAERYEKLHPVIDAKLARHERLTLPEWEAWTGVRLSMNLTGKMDGVPAISTNCLRNGRCTRRQEARIGICAECYAFGLELAYSGACENTTHNYDVLNARLLEPWEVPDLGGMPRLRVEWSGDSGSVVHAANYTRIIQGNPETVGTVFSKNPDHYRAAFDLLGGKPENLVYIWSAQEMNAEPDIPEEYQGMVDHTFTVFTLDYLLEHGLGPDFINCGARSCKRCQNCYDRSDAAPFRLRELLKKDVARAEAMGWFLGDQEPAQEPAQELTSACTSINKNKVPSVYTALDKLRGFTWEGQELLDYGAGRFDTGLDFARARGAQVWAFDKFNRSAQENAEALGRHFDAALCSNVLNVVREPEVRRAILEDMARHAQVAYITVYQGDGTGQGRQTGADSWQENRKTADYLQEVQEVFKDVTRRGALIIARR